MDWKISNLLVKKSGLLILSIIIVLFIFVLTLDELIDYNSPLSAIFFIIYAILVGLLFKKYSKKILIILVILAVSYLLIMMIPFQICHSYIDINESTSKVKDCTCIGVEKLRYQFAGPVPTQCVGIIKNNKTTCYEFIHYDLLEHLGDKAGYEGYQKVIPCK